MASNNPNPKPKTQNEKHTMKSQGTNNTAANRARIQSELAMLALTLASPSMLRVWNALNQTLAELNEERRQRRTLREQLGRAFGVAARSSSFHLSPEVDPPVAIEVETEYQLQGSEETLATLEEMILLLPADLRPGACTLARLSGGRCFPVQVNCTGDTLHYVLREVIARQENLVRAIFDPVQGSDGLAARYERLERVRRLVEAALGQSRRPEDLVPLS